MPEMLPEGAWQDVVVLPRLPEYPSEITILCPTAQQRLAGKYLLQEDWVNGQRLWRRHGGEEMWLYSGHSGCLGALRQG